MLRNTRSTAIAPEIAAYALDWMMWLPEDFSKLLEQNIEKLEEHKKMRYITSIERSGMKRGLERGLEQGREEGRRAASTTLLRLLTRKFGEVSPTARNKIEQANLESIEAWTDQILDAKSVDELFASTDFKH